MADDIKSKRRILIISGMAGAGKSLVLNTLEDLDFYCIDNLPLSLFNQLTHLLADPSNNFPQKVAIGIDARSPGEEIAALPDSIALLREMGVNVEVLFLEASKDVLTTRFSETRRKHPLSSSSVSLSDAIDKERSILSFLSDMANLSLDTSHTAVHELRDIIRDRIAHKPLELLSIQFLSFGYKHGIPHDADFIFDVRCLPNPHWEKNLRKYSGKDKNVIDFLKEKPKVVQMLDQIKAFLENWVPEFEAENRSYLCIAIGCTGGRHRSVFLAEELARHFENLGKHTVLRHRDM